MNAIFSNILVLLFLGGSFFPSQAQQVLLDEVIATVGSELVLLSDLEDQYNLIRSQQQEPLPPDARCFILDNILMQKLLVNQAKLDSIEVSEEEVEAQLNARIDQILAYMNNDYQQFEEYYGQSVDEVKDQFREDLRNQLLSERMRAEILQNISVTPAEVKAFFDRIPQDSLPYFNSEVELLELAMKPEVSPERKREARERLEELRRRIVAGGEDFAELAKKYSDDFASARLGGDLGWTKRGSFVPEFEAAAYKLDEGEVSKVVETEFGFHIIQLLERKGNSIHTRHLLIRPEITEEDIARKEQELDSVRQLILIDSLSFSEAVKRFGTDEVQSYYNDGRMVNPRTGNTFFEIADLDPDVYFAIDTLKVGEITHPFRFHAANGEVLLRIVRLESQTAPHTASLEKDYARIKSATIQEKQARALSKWLEKVIRSTYVSLDKPYADCPNLKKWIELSD